MTAYMPYIRNIIVLSFMGVLFLQMTGCGTGSSSYSAKDGAPSYHIDAAKIPDAVPKREVHSRSVNPKSYVVRGKRYHVLASNQNYREVGGASWYGTKFHERKTATGESYDLAGMTAAHKTLRIPSYVRVRNLANDKTVVVKVNDRGPFHSSRIIDLSYVAAKKLGIQGVGKVEVSVIDPDTHQPISQPVSSGITSAPDKEGNQKLYLQMGVFAEKSNAEKIARSIEDHIQAPVQIKADQHNNQQVYRVRVAVENESKADMLYNKLAQLGKPMKVVE